MDALSPVEDGRWELDLERSTSDVVHVGVPLRDVLEAIKLGWLPLGIPSDGRQLMFIVRGFDGNMLLGPCGKVPDQEKEKR